MGDYSLPIRLTVLTGPSGVGKGVVVKNLLKRNKQIWLSVSATTRQPREGETDGSDYFFLSREKFTKLIAEDGLLEWAEFSGNLYGTPSEPVKRNLSQGQFVLLEIELEGARQVRKTFPEAFQIFLAPPSFEELERRIRGRGTDSEKSIERRLLRAKEELQAKNEFDAVVVNDQVFNAVSRLEELIGITKSSNFN